MLRRFSNADAPLRVPAARGNPAALELVLTGKVKVKPFVESHPLDDINRVFEAVHHREIRRRVVLVPGS